MKIVLATLDEWGKEEYTDILKPLEKHFQWVNEGVGSDFFLRLHVETQAFVREHCPYKMYVPTRKKYVKVTALKGMLTNSSLTFYPQFEM